MQNTDLQIQPKINVKIDEYEVNDSMHLIIHAEGVDFADAYLELEKKKSDLMGRGWNGINCESMIFCNGQKILVIDVKKHLPFSLISALNRKSLTLDRNWVYFAEGTPLWFIADWFDKEFPESNLRNSLTEIEDQQKLN